MDSRVIRNILKRKHLWIISISVGILVVLQFARMQKATPMTEKRLLVAIQDIARGSVIDFSDYRLMPVSKLGKRGLSANGVTDQQLHLLQAYQTAVPLTKGQILSWDHLAKVERRLKRPSAPRRIEVIEEQ